MVRWHLRSSRKPTGGRLNSNRKKMRADRGFEFLETKIGEPKTKIKRGKGGIRKIRVMASDLINLSDNKGKVTKTKILTVVSNTANPNYIRRNIITKGAIVKTELGEARVTSRPSQHGIINGVLVKKE